MTIHECGKLESEEKSYESANGVIVNHAASPKKFKIAGIADQIIQGREIVAIEPIDRQPAVEEIEKQITGSGKANKEGTKCDDENNPGRKDPSRVNG